MGKWFSALMEKWACKHDWKTFHKTVAHWSKCDGGGVAYYEFTLVCQHCGKFKKVRA